MNDNDAKDAVAVAHQKQSHITHSFQLSIWTSFKKWQ